MPAPEQPVAFVGPIHGNEFGGGVYERLQQQPLDGVVIHPGHPAAQQARVRMLGREGEMGDMVGKADGNPTNPDRQAARELHEWLTRTDPWVKRLGLSGQ